MTIRKTGAEDLCAICDIFNEARRTIAALGIDQWQNGYPSRDVVLEDIEAKQSYCVLDGDKIIATFALILDGEPTYDKIYEGTWLSGYSDDYIAMHRVAVSVACRGKGVSTAIVEYARQTARELGRNYVRIDTHRGNAVMRRMLEKHGFIYCGIIYLENGDERVAYEKRV